MPPINMKTNIVVFCASFQGSESAKTESSFEESKDAPKTDEKTS